MPSIFCSCSFDDVGFIQPLEEGLRRHGTTVWRAKETVYDQAGWPAKIGEAIKHHDLFILMWSQAASLCPRVRYEWSLAMSWEKPLLVYWLDATPLHPSLTSFQVIRADLDDKGPERLLTWVGSPLSRQLKRPSHRGILRRIGDAVMPPSSSRPTAQFDMLKRLREIKHIAPEQVLREAESILHIPLSFTEAREEEYRLLGAELPSHAASPDRQDPSTSRHADRQRTALCFSGGGIRSATYCLGVLRALSRMRLLDKFDYLSTVSGGGYIGSWLSAWIHRHPGGLPGVMEELATGSRGGGLHEADPVRWLRNYSNYLAPKLGFLSADSWTLIGIYLRNLLLNWTVLLPLLMIPLLTPRALIALVQMNTAESPISSPWVNGVLLVGLALAAVALIYLHLCRPHLHELRVRYGYQRLETQSWFLKACLAPLLLSTLCLTISWAWFRNAHSIVDRDNGQFTLMTMVVGATILHVGSWLFSIIALRRLRLFGAWFMGELAAIAGTGALGGFFIWVVLDNTPSEIPVARYAEWYACFGIPGFLAMFLLTATLFIGIASRVTDDHDREWWGRTGSWVLIAMVLWSVLSGVVVFGPGLLMYMPQVMAALGGLSGFITLVLGFSSKTPAKAESERSWRTMLSEAVSKAAAPIFMLCILILMAWGSSGLLDALAERFHVQALTDVTGPYRKGFSLPDEPLVHVLVLHNAPLWIIVELALILAALGMVMAVTININQFSLHAMYRNRLIRAYLGASRPQSERQRMFNPFTGFDPRDNYAMCDLRFDDIRLARALYQRHLSEEARTLLQQCRQNSAEEFRRSASEALLQELQRLAEGDTLVELGTYLDVGPACAARLQTLTVASSDTAARHDNLTWLMSLLLNGLHEQSPRPLHVLNLALNLVRGDNLAWQQRKAQSFTISSLHCGSPNLGYRRSREYGNNFFLNRPISLGTALAISGAAASPNMGYHSAPSVTFLLALFNVRLGWWLGNPGPAGASTYFRSSPRFAVGPLFSEAFGLTDAGHPYVYVSDGGHFENLGLYEMVLRRCHSILVVDAGCDPTGFFEDLGNAIRKIHIDLGIEIEMNLEMLKRLPGSSVTRGHHGIGTIRYDKLDPTAGVGTILYLKPSLTGDEPLDVHEYAAHHPAFPHEPTLDQFFDESQFQSYSRLGEHAAWEVLSPAMPCADKSFGTVCEALRSQWVATPPEMQDFFLRETPGLAQLNELLRNDPDLIHYDLQLYPELQTLFGYQSPPNSAPDHRAALHACSAQVHVMEKVFYALKLHDYHAHPLSRGWMNLFGRWTASPTFREFWPMLCGSHSRQFVDFAHRHLNLSFTPALRVELCTDLHVLEPFFTEMAQECVAIPEYVRACRTAFEQPAPLGTDGKAARWTLKLSSSVTERDAALACGEIISAAAATVFRERELSLFLWVRSAYRGMEAGSRLMNSILSTLEDAYPDHTVSVEWGRREGDEYGDYRKAAWQKFYHRHGFVRDGAMPERTRMKRVLIAKEPGNGRRI